MARTLLFLSSDTFEAIVWQDGKLAVARRFGLDADGREQFATFLERHRHPALMLVDVIEEDFHLESIPHLAGPSRKSLIERKFEQYYRSTPFRQATFLKRQAHGRRDDDYLFSALTNPQRITPWLDILLSSHTPLIGIYSVPNISIPLLKNIADEHVLLLSWEKNAGLRQTYFHDKRLHFSRLISIPDGATFSDTVVAETPRTVQYLKSLSLPPPGETLSVHILCHARDLPELTSKLGSATDLHYAFMDIGELARSLQCKHVFEDSDATPLLLSLLARRPPPAHYANADHTHFYTLWQLRRLLAALTAATLIGGGWWSASSFNLGTDYHNETVPLQEQIESLRQQTARIRANFGNTRVPANDMKSVVLLARNLSQYAHLPHEILFELSAVMDAFPRITLQKLSWHTSPADAGPSPYPAQVISFEGMLEGFGSDHRRALDYLNHFQQTLSLHGYTVVVESLPLDVSPTGSISGELGNGTPGQFKLKLLWRAPS
ncbi:MAG: hypothetical protein Fur0040_11380 [Sideroxydans sp.]